MKPKQKVIVLKQYQDRNGAQVITIVVNGKICTYTNPEGKWVYVDDFVRGLK